MIIRTKIIFKSALFLVFIKILFVHNLRPHPFTIFFKKGMRSDNLQKDRDNPHKLSVYAGFGADRRGFLL